MKILFTICSVLFISTAFAQKTEYRFSLNSGLFHFEGASAESVTWITSYYPLDYDFTENTYGSNNGMCIGVSENLKHISKSHFLFGADIGFELLRSKILIDKVSVVQGKYAYPYPATGETILNYNFINANPFFGYRLATKKINLDFTCGFDVGYCLNATEDGEATTSNGMEFKTSADRKTISWDFRPRFQLDAGYKKFGAYLGYSIGVVDYKGKRHSSDQQIECYSRLFRFGLTYRLN